jgi:hypothetical protein
MATLMRRVDPARKPGVAIHGSCRTGGCNTLAHGSQRESPAGSRRHGWPHSSGATVGECRGHGRADHPLTYRPHAAARGASPPRQTCTMQPAGRGLARRRHCSRMLAPGGQVACDRTRCIVPAVLRTRFTCSAARVQCAARYAPPCGVPRCSSEQAKRRLRLWRVRRRRRRYPRQSSTLSQRRWGGGAG